MVRWGMVIDLRKCIGCATCKEVCERVNENPSGVWRRVIEHGTEGNPGQERLFLTMSCMHCGRPLCLETCPTGATYRRPDGIVDIKEYLCIGCRACILACPYRAREILIEDVICRKEAYDQEDETITNSDRIGICTKCNFCFQLIDSGVSKGLKPGVDPEATPWCVRFCISEALSFGDLDDPDSTVSKLIRENRTSRLLEELNTDPKIHYILK
jgi:phenylacetyl-CoA:acceptor oxidoreductase subunit 1